MPAGFSLSGPERIHAAPAPGVIRVRMNGGGIGVVVFGGLAASRRPEQPHLARPGRDRRAAGPAGSRRRRNGPDPGPGFSERHCHRSRLYRRPLCSGLLPRSSPAGPGRPHARLGGGWPGPSRGIGSSGRPPGRPRLGLTPARLRRQAARLRDRGLSRRLFACSFGVAARGGPHRRRRGRCRCPRRVGRGPPTRAAGRAGRGCRRVLFDGVSCCSHRRQRRCPRAGPPWPPRARHAAGRCRGPPGLRPRRNGPGPDCGLSRHRRRDRQPGGGPRRRAARPRRSRRRSARDGQGPGRPSRPPPPVRADTHTHRRLALRPQPPDPPARFVPPAWEKPRQRTTDRRQQTAASTDDNPNSPNSGPQPPPAAEATAGLPSGPPAERPPPARTPAALK